METSQSNPSEIERVTTSDAVRYLKNRTGFAIDGRLFRRWCESGCVTVNELQVEIETSKIGLRWFITRRSLEHFITQIK